MTIAARLMLMTASEIQDLFDSLDDPDYEGMPQGQFSGVAWSHDMKWVRHVNRAWTGKVFTDDKVVNIIFGRKMIEGIVQKSAGTVGIFYPQLKLVDLLRPLDDGSLWLGKMNLNKKVLWFVLEKEL